MEIPFWANDYTILFNKEFIFELWPSKDMTYEQKINAISRLVILVTILGFIITLSKRILFIGLATLVVIFIMFKIKKENITKNNLKERFTSYSSKINNENISKIIDSTKNHNQKMTTTNPITLDTLVKTEFQEGTKKNPFSNVLLTEIHDNPNRKAAPPAFNPDIEEDITTNIKKSVQYMNPEIKNSNKQLFGDLWEKFNLDQSNRNFYSTPNTRVTNDQGAFANFLYGNMPSSKGSSSMDNLQREKDNQRYTLY